MQMIRFLTAFTLAALATAIALDAGATPPPRDIVTAEQIETAVGEAQLQANLTADGRAMARKD